MQKPSARLLMFYLGTLAGVGVLFYSVTAYGEKQLKAPLNIAGTYDLTAPKLPRCLRDRPLKIQQSGAFLTANFPTAADPNRLTGQLEGADLVLKLEGLDCPGGDRVEQLVIRSVVEKHGLVGVMEYRSSNPLTPQVESGDFRGVKRS
jgi:hypothetical protein